MRRSLRQRLCIALIAFVAAAGAHAQSRSKDGTVELPVWNQATGKVEAVLLLEPTQSSIGIRKQFSEGALIKCLAKYEYI